MNVKSWKVKGSGRNKTITMQYGFKKKNRSPSKERGLVYYIFHQPIRTDRQPRMQLCLPAIIRPGVLSGMNADDTTIYLNFVWDYWFTLLVYGRCIDHRSN